MPLRVQVPPFNLEQVDEQVDRAEGVREPLELGAQQSSVVDLSEEEEEEEEEDGGGW